MKSTPSRILLACLLLVSTALAGAEALIPGDLSGIWAGSQDEFRDGAIQKGSALYLMPDGRGALVAGPPPIGLALQAKFDPASQTLLLHVNTTDAEQPTVDVMAHYDPVQKTIHIPQESAGKPAPLVRRFDAISPSIQPALHLTP